MAAEWLNQVSQATIRKQEAAMKKGFRRFAKNWLLMADKSPFLFLDVELALSGLEADMAVRTHEPFDRIFILRNLIEITFPSLFEAMSKNGDCTKRSESANGDGTVPIFAISADLFRRES